MLPTCIEVVVPNAWSIAVHYCCLAGLGKWGRALRSASLHEDYAPCTTLEVVAYASATGKMLLVMMIDEVWPRSL